jgi:hypothetical protein
MKKLNLLCLLICVLVLRTNTVAAQNGYYDAPYLRYEADLGTLTNASATSKSYAQSDLQSEASEQVCVNMTAANAAVSWTVAADGDGLVVRYSVPDGESGVLQVYANNALVGTLNLSSNWSWESLWNNGNPNNSNIVNKNPKMRFDEVRLKLGAKILAGGTLKLLRTSGNVYLDFAELESVPAAATPSPGVTYNGDGSTLQAFIDGNGGKNIFLPAGKYYVNRELYFGTSNTTLKGAGMWYTEINFTETNTCDGGGGGLNANASNISYSGLYLTTVRNSRSCSYKAINGVYTAGSTITNVWAEHFECGAWIAQYNNGPAYADGFNLSYCRFRNNYADGINLCKGTSNAVVEHCSFRNNGDDDMAIWPQNGSGHEGQNNTFRYSTSENCWRASGCAIYGGYNHSAHHLLIKDNVEVGLRVGNNFPGVAFNAGGMHVFSNITIVRCGTFNDLYNSPVGAIDILCDNQAGTRINNVKFSNITINDAKNDGIYIYKKAGEGFYNLVFENIIVNGTGREYPNNNANNLNWGRGYDILFSGLPAGYGTYCNMNYSNRGGNAASNTNIGQIGTFSWTSVTSCIPPVCNAVNIPATIQAENFCDMFGVQTENATDVGAGLDVGYIDVADWMSYKINVPSAGEYAVQYRVASNTSAMSLKLESLGGATTYGVLSVPNTGGWQTWQTITHNIQLSAGVQDIALTTTTGGFNVNWINFSSTVGLAEIQSVAFKMYPNPVGELLHVNADVSLREFAVYDAAGRLVFKQSNPGNNFTVDTQNFAAGYYTVVATDVDFNKQTSSLVK